MIDTTNQPPAAQPVAWTMRDLCRLYAYAYRAGHEDTCEACYTHVVESDVETFHQDELAEYLADHGMSATPDPRVAELEEQARHDDLSIAILRRRNEKLEGLLRLILPMAKGYAIAHPVGSNAQYVADVEAALNKEGA